MSLIFLFFSVAVSIFMLSRAIRGDLATIPIVFVSLMMCVAWLAWHLIYYSPFAQVWSKYGAYYQGEKNLWYFMAICLLYIAAYCLATVTTPQSDFRAKLREALESFKPKSLTAISCLLAVFAFYHASILDPDVLWETQNYLEIGSVRGLKHVTPVTALVQMLSKYVGVLTFVCLASAIVSCNRLATVICLLPAAWFMIFDIAGHSRFAVVHAGIAAAILLFDKRSSSKALGLVFLGLTFLNLVNALAGRSSGEHGIASLGNFFTYASTAFKSDVAFMFGNVFEGAFVQGEVFLYENVQHDPLYKLLSLSPFPSGIDGFAHKARHHTFSFISFVPMSATGEAYLFGFPYTIAYFSVVFVSYYLTVRAMRLGRIGLFLPMFMSVSLATYLQFAYPIRNVFRFFILAILIYAAAYFWRWMRKLLVQVSRTNVIVSDQQEQAVFERKKGRS